MNGAGPGPVHAEMRRAFLPFPWPLVLLLAALVLPAGAEAQSEEPPRDVLDLLAVATPRAIFPDRAIGRLTEASEASFLVLDADPLADASNLASIRGAMKQGLWLERPVEGESTR